MFGQLKELSKRIDYLQDTLFGRGYMRSRGLNNDVALLRRDVDLILNHLGVSVRTNPETTELVKLPKLHDFGPKKDKNG